MKTPKLPTKVCECCGAKVVEYKHSLNALLVRTLQKSWRVSAQGKYAFKVGANEIFSYSEASNFQKLKYWGFVAPSPNTDGTPRAGWWYITETGEAFLHNDIKAFSYLWSYRGELSASAHLHDVAKSVSIRDVDDNWVIPQRPDYAQTAAIRKPDNQIDLFDRTR